MKKEIGWRERKKEGRGLFFSSSDIDNLIFTITILKKRRVLASIDQAVQPQSNIQKCDWDGRLEGKETRKIQADLKCAKPRRGFIDSEGSQ